MLHEDYTCMYNGIYDIQGLQKGKPQESKQPPGSGGASLRCTAGLKRWCCMHGIYTCMLPADKRERWHGGWG